MKISKKFQHQDIQGFKFGSWPFGKPTMYSHCYFVDGLLIDTSHRNMRQAVMEVVQPLAVEQIFVTHHHEDHTGNLLPIQQHFNCPTYGSEKCVDLMQNPPKISFAQWLTWGKAEANFNIEVCDNQLHTNKYTFDLIPIPGHAEDMLCLHEANQGWLFSADLWVKEYIRFFMRPEQMMQQIESMKRVMQLDFEVMLCSHNPQLEGGKAKLAQKLAFMEAFYERAAQFHRQGYPAKEILKKMNLKEDWGIRILSGGALSTINMVKAVIRDEEMNKELVT